MPELSNRYKSPAGNIKPGKTEYQDETSMDTHNISKKEFISVDTLIKDAINRSRKQFEAQFTQEKQAAMAEDFKKRLVDLNEGR